MKELSEKEALCKAAAYCSAAEHCRAEVAGKLTDWGVEPEAQQRIIERLLAEKYIDEERYCRFFIHDKLRYNRWGRNKIAQALRLKQIDRSLIAAQLDGIDGEEYDEVLRTLIAAKRKSVKARNDYELNGKLMRFALGRGFEMDEIRRNLSLSDDDDWNDTPAD